MPELPEIEVLRRSLAPRLAGRRIVAVDVLRPDLREEIAPGVAKTVGRVFGPPGRRGKYLLLPTDGETLLAVHLGMSGRLTIVPPEEPVAVHEHLAWRLEGGDRLRFVDPRRFGLVLALPREGWSQDRHFAHLGLEPLADEWSGAALASRVSGRRGPVKGFLMDGRAVVGVGNIYASESLFRAGVHPTRPVDRISAGSWARLAVAVRETLEEAITHGGTTLRDFVDGGGLEGANRGHLLVYDREGEPCPRCGRSIRRRVQAGRSTFYCPACQR